jgi:hypothetical protein
MRRPALVWTGAALAVGSLAVFLWLQGLERANQWSSVLSLFLTIAGSLLSLAGLTGRRSPASGRQSADGASAGGSVQLVRNVGGDVVITGTVPAGRPAAPQGSAVPPSTEGQSTQGTQAGGGISQVDGIGGSVRIGDAPGAPSGPTGPAGP